MTEVPLKDRSDEDLEHRLPIASLEEFADAHGLVMEVHERDPQWWARRDVPFQPFYASFKSVEMKYGPILTRSSGNGQTPSAAMADYANKISLKRIVVDAMLPCRREINVPRLTLKS